MSANENQNINKMNKIELTPKEMEQANGAMKIVVVPTLIQKAIKNILKKLFD